MMKCHSKDILESYKDNTIKFYLYILKNMESLEKNTGILTKDFIKKFIDRENELENIIFELREQIKALESSGDKGNDVPRGYDIFMKMIKYASISWSIGDRFDNMPTLSINDYPLMPDEVEYVKKLIAKREEEAITGKFDRLSFNKEVRVDVGIEGSPRYLDNLDSDRAWP